MSDLINRRELIKHFEAIQQEENVVGLAFVAAIDEIKGQPTAYNIDKVVEELELHSFELGTDTIPAHYVRLNEAIEIVKQGGVSDVSDNVCEWEKYPFDWFTGCDGYRIYNKQGDYCPRCGKKIKIVGD